MVRSEAMVKRGDASGKAVGQGRSASPQLRGLAKRHWALGVSAVESAKVVGVTPKTIYAWRKKWKEEEPAEWAQEEALRLQELYGLVKGRAVAYLDSLEPKEVWRVFLRMADTLGVGRVVRDAEGSQVNVAVAVPIQLNVVRAEGMEPLRPVGEVAEDGD